MFCFMFVRTVCSPNGPFHQPTVPTGYSSVSWFNLIEAVAVTVALGGTAKGRRFIFLYFSYFLYRLIFYICSS